MRIVTLGPVKHHETAPQMSLSEVLSSPTTLGSDGGGIFEADRAKAIYAALHITHTPIERRQPWQSYIETHFGVQRRLSDYYFVRATSWE